ncbi:MAG: hypothetical protein JNL38_22000 [Myxococcales bacterium]|nr:hypothetical protein [Myxococcales bacterium]
MAPENTASRRRRRVYVEMMRHEELIAPPAMSVVTRWGVGVVLAVRPWDLDGLPRVLAVLHEAGVDVTLWPMLADEAGRWASAWNAEPFAAMAEEVLKTAAAAGSAGAAAGLLVDLEPPIERMRAWLARPLADVVRDLASRRPPDRLAGGARLAALVAEARAGGRDVEAAVAPFLVFDRVDVGRWARVLGTPLDAEYTHVTAMAYTSILEGWSRGVLARSDTEALLGVFGERAQGKVGARAGLSLGAVGHGALGTEPCYRDVGELARDVAIAVHSGVDDLVLFELAGVLARPPAHAWMEAFTRTPAAAPPDAKKRVRLLTHAMSLAGR